MAKKVIAYAACCKTAVDHEEVLPCEPALEEQMRRPAPIANMIAQAPIPKAQESSVSILPHAPVQDPAVRKPVLFHANASNCGDGTQTTRSVTLEPSFGRTEDAPQKFTIDLSEGIGDQWELKGGCSPRNVNIDAATLVSTESYEQPASSLVSPPASLHDDVRSSPAGSNHGWPSSASSSRHSSSQPKQMQPYTPDSGSMRRASSCSYDENAADKALSSALTEPTLGQTPEVIGLNPECVADQESMRLIKELQAQERKLGLSTTHFPTRLLYEMQAGSYFVA